LTEPSRLPVVAVILAGGSGTRLWPLATGARPKQFLPLLRGSSLFRRTYERAVSVAGRPNVLVVAGAAHASWVRREARGIERSRILLEERGRNTACSVALAALWLLRNRGDAIMVVLPSDHLVGSLSGFRGTVRRAVAAVRKDRSLLVTIGVPPRGPDTGFGYIRRSDRLVAPGVHRVDAFVEKPPKRVARKLVRSRHVFWNSGIFVWTSTSILEELRRHRPDILGPAESWARRARGQVWRVPGSTLRSVPASPIDRAVLERSRATAVTRAGFHWSDVGNWGALADLLAHDRGSNAAIGKALFPGSTACLAVNEGGFSAVVGLKDVVAVRAGDAMLVCHRSAVQQVRDVAAHPAARRAEDL
jgi:mannose-1-phosphate guanylyltransferase/mannose-6-phosphate isomerase